MSRLVPNPIGELTGPLSRIDRTLTEVKTTLVPVGELTQMAADIAATRALLETLVVEIAALRHDLAERVES